MKYLVTGGDGFVGEHLLVHLVDRGASVTASALRLPPERTVLSPEAAKQVEWKSADVRDPDAMYRLVAAVRPARVFHLAGFASGWEARQRPAQAVEVNAGGTVNLMEAIRRAREDFPDLDPLVLVMGSGDAYGEPQEDTPLRESAPLRPATPYGLSKACQEMVAHTYRRAYGIRTTVARAFHLVGPGQKPSFVVPDFCAQVAEIAAGRREPVIEVGNLDAERDFTDVRDGVRALCEILELPEPRPAYNLCTGRPTRVGSLLEWIVSEAQVQAEVRTAAERLRPGEPPRIVGDPTLLQTETGWQPTRDLEESVREVYRWTRKNLGSEPGPEG